MGEPVKREKRPEAVRPPEAELHTLSMSSVLPTVETSDPVLADSLRKLSAMPTPEVHHLVAERYRALGILDMAYDHFLSALQLDRTDALAYEGLARIWRDWGFPGLGAADAARAVFYAPSSASSHNTWGTVLAAMGHSGEARREYDRAIQLDPKAAYAWNNLCSLSFRSGDAPRAAAECGQALSLDPGLAAARRTLASLERLDKHDADP